MMKKIIGKFFIKIGLILFSIISILILTSFVLKIWVFLLPFNQINIDKLESDRYLNVLILDVRFGNLSVKHYQDAALQVNAGIATFKVPETKRWTKINQSEQGLFFYRYKATNQTDNELIINVQRVDEDYETHSRYVVENDQIVSASRKSIHAMEGIPSFFIALIIFFSGYALFKRYKLFLFQKLKLLKTADHHK